MIVHEMAYMQMGRNPVWGDCPLYPSGPHVFNSSDPTPLGGYTRFDRDTTTKGDHVMANDYWSDIEELVVSGPSSASGRWGWTTSNNPTNDVPPTACISTSVNCGSVTCGFNPLGYYAGPDARWKLPSVDRDVLEFAKQLADTKALANLNRSLVNLPMLFKERKETIKMMGDRVSQLGRAARDVQERDLSRWRKAISKKDKRSVARDVSNSHLEMIFGWLPLIGEIEGALEFAQMPSLDFVRARGIHFTELGSSDVRQQEIVNAPFGATTPNPYLLERLGHVQMKGFEMRSVSVRTALRYELETAIAADARLLGFEPIATFYDMVPLSFVSGWFSNFDAYVRTIAPLIGVTFKTGSRNIRTRAMWEASASFLPVMPLNNSSRYWWDLLPNCDGSVVGRKELNTRFKLTEPPVASLRWDVDVGLYEVAAGVSLAVQRYLKPLKRLIKQKPFRYRGPRPRNLPDIRYRRP